MTADVNILSDLSTLTTVPTKALTELVRYECLCIGNAVKQATLQEKNKLVLNIGLGALCINITTMECKFLPSSELKNTIKTCLAGKQDLLMKAVEDSISEKLLKLYEGVLG